MAVLFYVAGGCLWGVEAFFATIPELRQSRKSKWKNYN